MSESRTVDDLAAGLRYARTVNAALPRDEDADAPAERFFRDARRAPDRKIPLAKKAKP